MKRKFARILLALACVLLLAGICRTAIIYFGNMYPNRMYFGNQYTEIILPTSLEDRFIAREVLNEAETALSTITDEEDAVDRFGKLGFLCVTNSYAASETHDLDFIAARFTGRSGYIWVKYSTEAYDKDGTLLSGSWRILSRWELIQNEDGWIVTTVREHP